MSQQLDNPFVGCTDVSKASGKQWMTKLTNLVNGFITSISALNSPINNSSASSDVSLSIGQKAYVAANGATSIPLHIATASGQQYEITLMGQTGYNSSGATYGQLYPNNSSSPWWQVNTVYGNGSAAGSVNLYNQGALLEMDKMSPVFAKITVSTLTAYKQIFSMFGNFGNVFLTGLVNNLWVTGNGATTPDTTTAWTSLGTISLPYAWTGTMTIERKF